MVWRWERDVWMRDMGLSLINREWHSQSSGLSSNLRHQLSVRTYLSFVKIII